MIDSDPEYEFDNRLCYACTFVSVERNIFTDLDTVV